MQISMRGNHLLRIMFEPAKNSIMHVMDSFIQDFRESLSENLEEMLLGYK